MFRFYYCNDATSICTIACVYLSCHQIPWLTMLFFGTKKSRDGALLNRFSISSNYYVAVKSNFISLSLSIPISFKFPLLCVI